MPSIRPCCGHGRCVCLAYTLRMSQRVGGRMKRTRKVESAAIAATEVTKPVSVPCGQAEGGNNMAVVWGEVMSAHGNVRNQG